MTRRSKFAVALTVLLFWNQFALAEAQPGDYIALRGEIVGCEPGVRVLDFARVAPDGKVRLLDKYTIAVVGLNNEQITEGITQAIAKETGREPKTLQVSIVEPDEIAGVAVEAMATWNCSRPAKWPFDSEHQEDRAVPPGERPPYENDYDERVANAITPDEALQQTIELLYSLDPYSLYHRSPATLSLHWDLTTSLVVRRRG